MNALRRKTAATASPARARGGPSAGPGNLAMQNSLRGLKIGAANDPQERAADAVADAVMQGHAAPCSCGGSCSSCGGGKTVRSKGDGSGDAPSRMPSHAALDGGRLLERGTRAFFEPRMGRGLADVRIHSDAKAGALAQSVSARAFTVGSDIVFADGAYDPGSTGGRRLLAHELAHVAQQDGNSQTTLRRQEDDKDQKKKPGGRGPGLRVEVIGEDEFDQMGGDGESLPEGTFVPASAIPSKSAPADPVADSLGGLGAAMTCVARPPLPMPLGSTGIMWQGSHISDIAAVPVENPFLRLLLGNETIAARGFRAELWRHAGSMAERGGSFPGSAMTDSLNAGTPGGYYNDWMFPYQNGTAVTRPRSVEEAQEFVRLMEQNAANYAGKDYRFSTPPRDSPFFDQAFGAGKAADPNFEPPAIQNCINLPGAEHAEALGGEHMVIARGDQLIDIKTGQDIRTGEVVLKPNASAAAVRDYLNQPNEFFASRLLERSKVGSVMRLRAAAGVIKVGGLVLLVYSVGKGIGRYEDAVEGVSGEDPNVVAGEEIGSQAGGWVGSVLSSALAGAFICAETGPGAFFCALGFGIAGGITGGTFGGGAGHELGEAVTRLENLTPHQAMDSWTLMFGTPEQKRAMREMHQIDALMTGDRNGTDLWDEDFP